VLALVACAGRDKNHDLSIPFRNKPADWGAESWTTRSSIRNSSDMKIVTEISADIHTTLEPVNTPHSVIRNRGCEDDSTRNTFVAGGRAHNLTKDCESGTSDRKVPDDADPGPGTRNLTDDNNTAEETVEKEAGPGAGDAIGNAGPDVGGATGDAGPGAGDAVDDVGPVTRDVTDAVVTAVVDETICESPGGKNVAGDEGFDAESKLGEGGPAVGDVIVVASSGARGGNQDLFLCDRGHGQLLLGSCQYSGFPRPRALPLE
jgi:hypothetical protein